MPNIEIGFRAIVGHEYLAVLEGIHGAGINVDVRVELLHRDRQAARAQQAAKGGSGEAFT